MGSYLNVMMQYDGPRSTWLGQVKTFHHREYKPMRISRLFLTCSLQEAPRLVGTLMPRVLALVDPAAVAKLTRYKGLRSGLRMLSVRLLTSITSPRLVYLSIGSGGMSGVCI